MTTIPVPPQPAVSQRSQASSRSLELFLTLLILLTTLGQQAVAQSPQSPADEAKSFDIAAQPLEGALIELSRQADVQVMVAGDVLKGHKTQRLKGTLSTRVALATLLKDTGLEAKLAEADNTVTVTREASRSHLAEDRSQGASQTPPSQPLPPAQRPGSDKDTANRQPSRESETAGQALEEVVVTGTHIRGKQPIGTQVQLIGTDYIRDSGYATIQDVLKTLPQNPGGGPSEDFNLGNTGNFNRATTVNLRGLGADSTLVLVNGRRQALGGTVGAFVDVSSIPVAAVERVEVLTDGASAIYGSDAVGGVVNIILRRDFQGAESSARWGMLGGDEDELRVSQLIGHNWGGGHALVGYQYYDRDALEKRDRAYTADTDQRRFGGDNFSFFFSNPGNIIDLATFAPAFAIPSGQDGTGLSPSDLLPGVVNFQNLAEQSDLLPDQTMHSAFFEAAQRISERVELFAEGRYSRRDIEQRMFGFPALLFVPSSNPFFVDPFGGSPFVVVGYSFINDLGPTTGIGRSTAYSATIGATAELGESWAVAFAGSYGKDHNRWRSTNALDFDALDGALADPDPATALNPFGDGSNTNPATLDMIRTTQHERGVSDIWAGTLKADGPVFRLPGGAAELAVGLDYRDENFVAGAAERTSLTRDVGAVFAELALPFVNDENARSGLRQLSLSLAGRYEDYSDFGETFNPKLGLEWLPLEALRLRGTWGTSFKAPRLVDLNEQGAGTNTASLELYPDPLSPSGRSVVLVLAGNNANLQEETATIWTAGMDFTLSALRDLSFSLTYFDIDYEDRVAQGGPAGRQEEVLRQEAEWAAIINRNPSEAEIQAICNGPTFVGSTGECAQTPPAAIVDFRLRNLAVVRVRGVDATILQDLSTLYGDFQLRLDGSYMLGFERAPSEASALVDVVDTVNNPLGLRMRSMLAWSHGGTGRTPKWRISAALNYADSYKDTFSTPNRDVGSWTTVDLGLSYRTPDDGAWLEGAEIAFSAVNAFDEEPPFVNSALGYDHANSDLYGRILSVQVTKKWGRR